MILTTMKYLSAVKLTNTQETMAAFTRTWFQIDTVTLFQTVSKRIRFQSVYTKMIYQFSALLPNGRDIFYQLRSGHGQYSGTPLIRTPTGKRKLVRLHQRKSFRIHSFTRGLFGFLTVYSTHIDESGEIHVIAGGYISEFIR